ncbi:lipopolysaccharide biosynthesis protein [Paucibacter sp. R3-3]|uniref:Lipopolysaccharide biosynthesis protein n=1 Tax=Roseateles agri TaxID=3098619 RepID=A0ABU5DEW4_9BURK|nr:lipopolysaccharide biosynthesis protein [Paucibacter sp. R3-3]MDY0744285.1 lipopolysaccharide biosynthesis protein [Paucibacter sp. R3-3]
MTLRVRFAQLASASALSQALPLLVAPMLTRWYGASALGHWALFAAVAANLATIANARYEFAIVLPRRDGEAALLLQLALWIAVGMGLLTALGTAVWHFGMAHHVKLGGRWASLSALDPWLLMLAPVVALAGMQQALSLWNNRQGRIAVIAQARVLQQGGMAAAQALAVLTGWTSVGALVVAQTVAALLAPLWLLRRGTRWRRATRLDSAGKTWHWRHLRRLASRYQQFPLLNSPHAFANAAQETLVLALIAAFADVATAGYYALMVRLVKAPASLVGGALSEALVSELARDWQRGVDLRPRLVRTIRLLAMIALPCALLLIAAGPALFGWLLGADWSRSGEYGRWLAPYVAAHFIAAPLTVTPMVTGRQRGALAFSLVGNVLYVLPIAAVLMSRGGALVQALAAISVLLPVYFALYLRWLLRGAAPQASLLKGRSA